MLKNKQQEIVLQYGTILAHDSDLQGQDSEFNIREIEVSFKKEKGYFGKGTSNATVVRLLRKIIGGSIEIQEHFIVLLIGGNGNIIGYYRHAIGSRSKVYTDSQLVAAVALKTMASAVIVAHNHPNGSLKPSQADLESTAELRSKLNSLHIYLADHYIITAKSYFSFTENNVGRDLAPLEFKIKVQELRNEILEELTRCTEANSPIIYEMLNTADGYKQLEELIIVRIIRTTLPPSAIIPQLEQEFSMNA